MPFIIIKVKLMTIMTRKLKINRKNCTGKKMKVGFTLCILVKWSVYRHVTGRSIESTDFTDQGKQQKALRKKRGKEER